jgi:hypothetical protein
MAEAERWTQDNGTEPSKWQTMPELMFRYRAAMFFARIHCPGALLGLRSTEELEEMQMIDVTPERPAVTQGNGEDKAAAIQKFNESIIPHIGTESIDHLDEFLKLTAQASRYKDTDSLKVAISSDLDRFWESYAKWEAKKYPKQEPKAEQKANGEGPQPPPVKLAPQEQEASASGSGASNPTALVLETEHPELFKQACHQLGVGRPMTDAIAINVLAEASKLDKAGWKPKGKK